MQKQNPANVRTLRAGKPLSYWKELAAKFPAEPKPAPQAVVQRISVRELYEIMEPIQENNITLFKKLFGKTLETLHPDDALEILIAGTKEGSQSAKKLLREKMAESYGPEFAKIFVKVLIFGFDYIKGWGGALDNLIDTFPEEQKQLLIENIIFHGKSIAVRMEALERALGNSGEQLNGSRLIEILTAIDKEFYDSNSNGYAKCRTAFDLASKLPKKYLPRIIESILNSKYFHYSIHIDAIKMISELPDGQERLYQAVFDKVREIIVHKSLGFTLGVVDTPKFISDSILLLPEKYRLQIFDELIKSRDGTYLAHALVHLEILPDSYKTDEFFEKCANILNGLVRRSISPMEEQLKIVFEKLHLFPPKSREALISAGISSRNISTQIAVIKQINQLPNDAQKRLWSQFGREHAFTDSLNVVAIPSGQISAVGDAPEEYRVDILCKWLKRLKLGNASTDKEQHNDELLGIENLLLLMNNTSERYLYQVIRAGLKSPMENIGVAAFELRTKISNEYDYQGNIMADALASTHGAVALMAFDCLSQFTRDQQEILLMYTASAGSVEVRKRALEYAIAMHK